MSVPFLLGELVLLLFDCPMYLQIAIDIGHTREKRKSASFKMSNNNCMNLEREIVIIRILCTWEQDLTYRNVGTNPTIMLYVLELFVKRRK